MKKTKVVCTIGPASDSVDVLTQMAQAGMNVARLNFSHGTYKEHAKRIEHIREVEKKTGITIGIMLDTKGPEIRTHTMENGLIYLKRGQEIRIAMSEVVGTSEKFSITYKKLIHDVKIGTTILLDDGLIRLVVKEVDYEKNELVTTILNTGELSDRKGVNVPGVDIDMPALTERDRLDIQFGLNHGIDFIAPSFIRKAENIVEIRKILEKEKKINVQIIPKIENKEAITNFNAILNYSDGIMVARGDLGVELPVEEVPLIQKKMIRQCNAAGKPVIIATHMLDSMVHSPRPTRAETNDVANAIFDGTDALMLSAETAVGKYPVATVHMMTTIAVRTEEALLEQDVFTLKTFDQNDTAEAIGKAVGHTAKNLQIKTIVAATESGHTARMISKYRPKAFIVAVTSRKETLRALTLQWGVEPILAKKPRSTDDIFNLAAVITLERGYSEEGDLILITAGVPVGESGTTNLMKIQLLGSTIVNGQGIGDLCVVGRAVVAHNAREANAKMHEGAILVVKTTDPEYLPAIRQASALVVEDGSLTSYSALRGIEQGIPVLVQAEQATAKIEQHELITVDERRGIVYRGSAPSI